MAEETTGTGTVVENKPGGKTTEFYLNTLGPYGIVFMLLSGLMDDQTIELIKVACSNFSPQAQALAALAIKALSILGGIFVGGKAVDATKAYTVWRSQLKQKVIDGQMRAAG